jgi:hypothetical protein
MLRSLFDEPAAQRFLRGDYLAWNPFALTAAERAFFLYHLGEVDAPLWYIAFTIGSMPRGAVIGPGRAREIARDQLRELTHRSESAVTLSDLPKFRTARMLLAEIETELDPATPAARGQPRRASIRSSGAKRKTTKHADHEAIPRFEQLVDLGFLTKNVAADATGEKLEQARNAWTFTTTDVAVKFNRAFGESKPQTNRTWHRERFAQVVSDAGIFPARDSRVATDAEAFDLFANVYERFSRRVGHTPFESLAILTMLRALEHGLRVEVAHLHRMMVGLKRDGGLSGRIFFAAGNSVDRMFVLLKTGAREAFRTAYPSGNLPDAAAPRPTH